jgi:hypothetical protein
MHDMNAVHEDSRCDGVREKSYKTCLSQQVYLTDLTAHKSELRLQSTREPRRNYRSLRQAKKTVNMIGITNL